MTKALFVPPLSAPRGRHARLFLAMVLRAASLLLDRLALRLVATAAPASAASSATHLEFHAQAGALEGALYVDGELVGRLPGITRL